MEGKAGLFPTSNTSTLYDILPLAGSSPQPYPHPQNSRTPFLAQSFDTSGAAPLLVPNEAPTLQPLPRHLRPCRPAIGEALVCEVELVSA